jgi:SAM-dependent methyltransferase
MLKLINSHLPWWLKLTIKLFISILPVKLSFWNKFGFFIHGDMLSISYSKKIFMKHFNRFKSHNKNKIFTMLEIGPGDSVTSALYARNFGASSVFLIDQDFYASTDLDFYQKVISHYNLKNIYFKSNDFKAFLNENNTYYLTNGLNSFRHIKTSSIDFIFSNAVLEHIRKQDLEEYFIEMKRVLKPGGFISHTVDLKDHLGGGLNNLRFSDSFWDSNLVLNSGFYTNRVRMPFFISVLKGLGFQLIFLNKKKWNKSPINRKSLSLGFREGPNNDLLIKEFDIFMKLKK